MFAWVLIFWIGAGNGGPATINDIASEGDCEYLASKVVPQWNGHPDNYSCTRYRKAK